MSAFKLPNASEALMGPVKAWSEPVTIPTYHPLAPDRNPMFLENRVYQGSSGRVYPLPFYDRISDVCVDHSWEAIHLENEFIRIMVLPQLGGRIHVGLDKTNNYDFIYRQNVIKPALVGLAGPWASGGIEFNWPQHHRPSTYMPTEVFIEHHDDGAVTVWCSEHEPMNRMKGMHGICLRPGKSLVELKARLFNRTELTQTFLWWANVATQVHERYQSFFPPDVSHVADHAKRAMCSFPLAKGIYYGVDYATRAIQGIPESQAPSKFVPPKGLYPADDLSWYSNIPVPTSYMAMGSREDFFGGYDFVKEAGIVHVANRHIAPGKKQWTWGNHDFGYAWDRHLTDASVDGIYHPYIELMAGVYTDNQPDFSFLAPGETRTFTQFWYPIQRIGPAKKANVDAAIAFANQNGKLRIAVAVTQRIAMASVVLENEGKSIERWSVTIAPDEPFVRCIDLQVEVANKPLGLTLLDEAGRVVIRYFPQVQTAQDSIPHPATEPLSPSEISGNDELYRTGLHLEQYRHATRSAEPYYREAIRRDPDDSRCHNSIGLLHYRRGEFQLAEKHFTAAVKSITQRNPNPLDGEAYYNLGLSLIKLGNESAAYDAFYKATWNYACQSASFYLLAQIDSCRGHWSTAIEHLDRVLRVNADHLQARCLKVVMLRKMNLLAEASELLADTLRLDRLDIWARYLNTPLACFDAQMSLDLALELQACGLKEEAIALLLQARSTEFSGVGPMIHYYLADLYTSQGNSNTADQHLKAAAAASSDYCFPSRLSEIGILRRAIQAQPEDASAHNYLATLFYDRRRYEEAIELWERVVHLQPQNATAWRNLGIGYFNIRRDNTRAINAYQSAVASAPDDARLFFERDQLWKRIGEKPARRISELEANRHLVDRRDDLTIELCTLYNLVGRPEMAQRMLCKRRFQPWEGGEGLVLAQHGRTQIMLGNAALADNNASKALDHFYSALLPPENLGESRHLLANLSEIHYWIGTACDLDANQQSAREHWVLASCSRNDFQDMSVQPFSEMTLYSALALKRLGRHDEAERLLTDLQRYSQELESKPAKLDYFATSLPAMLLFREDLQGRQTIRARFLNAQAQLGLAHHESARFLLQNVIELDPNHSMASELLSIMPGIF